MPPSRAQSIVQPPSTAYRALTIPARPAHPYPACQHTMRYFVEPVVLTINHLLSLGYKNIFMMGKSGGGWTTTVAAAVDPRISASFPIAGSVPLDLRVGAYAHADIGDYEQKVQKPYNAKMPWYLDA